MAALAAVHIWTAPICFPPLGAADGGAALARSSRGSGLPQIGLPVRFLDKKVQFADVTGNVIRLLLKRTDINASHPLDLRHAVTVRVAHGTADGMLKKRMLLRKFVALGYRLSNGPPIRKPTRSIGCVDLPDEILKLVKDPK